MAFLRLQDALKKHRGGVETTALQGTFEENIDRILAEIGSAFSFFFIDPTGWKGLAMEKLRPVLERQPGEVMINFMYDFINRFVNSEDAATENSLDHFFGTPDWRSCRGAADREAALVNFYVEQVRAAGGFSYASYSHVLKPLHERTYFHLVYATRKSKGIEEFRRVEKRVTREQNLIRSKAQKENRVRKSGQTELDFLSTPSATDLEERRTQFLEIASTKVMTILRTGPTRYEHLLPRTLELPLVWETDVKSILLDGKTSGHLFIDGLGPRERSPKRGHTIRLRVASDT